MGGGSRRDRGMVRSAGSALTVFGAHAVLEALEGGKNVRVVYLKRGKFDAKTDQVTDLCKERGIPVHWTGAAPLYFGRIEKWTLSGSGSS